MAHKTNKIIFSSILGNALEFYDFTLCGVFISVLGKTFFPESSNPSYSLFFGLFAFSAAFYARPFGATLFGYLGDVYGRKVALKEDEIVGFVSVFMPSFIHNLFVYTPAQKQGVGTLLLRKAEEHLTHPMELKVALYNLKACPFYEKNGWTEASAHHDAPEPYLLYRKS